MPRTKVAKNGHKGTVVLEPVTNDAAPLIAFSEPYVAHVSIEGVSPMLFHRWSNEDVDGKGAGPKGSKTKKTDNIEAYVYRLDNGHIALPGEYLRQAIIHAARFRQDPRSPRKSAMDLFKAGIVALTELADLGGDYDYIDRRRVTIQRSAITRQRPAMNSGWRAEFDLQVNLPEYIESALLLDVIGGAGRFVGVADFRPTYGRFNVVGFEVLKK